MFTTYILYSGKIDKFYIGYTSVNIEVRLQLHLANHKGFTTKAKEWRVVYTEHFATKAAPCKGKKPIQDRLLIGIDGQKCIYTFRGKTHTK